MFPDGDLLAMEFTHIGTTVLATFLASLVECVEALTIVLAVGVSRGWKIALLGAGMGFITLILLVLVGGPFLTNGLFPIAWLQIVIGTLLLLFGLGWLNKAILRAAGQIPLHDEARIYDRQIDRLKSQSVLERRFDGLGMATSFKAVLIEGIEVIFIIMTVGAAQASLIPASAGAAAAFILVLVFGFMLRRPLTRVPENTLKFGVGILLTAFGFFWLGEGGGLAWPGHDLAILGLILIVAIVSYGRVHILKNKLPN